MKHTLEEIEKMFCEAHDKPDIKWEIISDLVEEINKLKDEKHKSELAHYTDGYRHAEVKFIEENKRLREALDASKIFLKRFLAVWEADIFLGRLREMPSELKLAIMGLKQVLGEEFKKD